MDTINNRNNNKGKLRHKEEEEKESDYINYSCEDEKNEHNKLTMNEPHQNVFREHKYLEERVLRLDATNDEVSYVGVVHQCHLTLMRNEKKVDWDKYVSECNELMIDCKQMEKLIQLLVKMHNMLKAKHRKLIND